MTPNCFSISLHFVVWRTWLPTPTRQPLNPLGVSEVGLRLGESQSHQAFKVQIMPPEQLAKALVSIGLDCCLTLPLPISFQALTPFIRWAADGSTAVKNPGHFPHSTLSLMTSP